MAIWQASQDELANSDMKLQLGDWMKAIEDGIKVEDIDPELMVAMGDVPDDAFDDKAKDVWRQDSLMPVNPNSVTEQGPISGEGQSTWE